MKKEMLFTHKKCGLKKKELVKKNWQNKFPRIIQRWCDNCKGIVRFERIK